MILLSAGSQWSTIVLIGGHQREMSKWLFNKDYRLDSCFMFYASAIRICRVEQKKRNPTHLEALVLVNSNFTIERNFNKSRWFASIFLLFFLHTKYAVSHFIPIWIACSADKPSPKWLGAHPTSLKAHQAFTVQRLIIQNAGRLHALLHLSTCVLSRMVAQFSWIERKEPFTQFPLVRQSTSANNCGWTPSAYVCVCVPHTVRSPHLSMNEKSLFHSPRIKTHVRLSAEKGSYSYAYPYLKTNRPPLIANFECSLHDE